MALIEQLFPASFRGIPFLIDTSEKSAGRKTVVHEFPNKKFRYVEDLGQNLRTFTIKGIILSNPALYLLNRTALEIALDTKGTGLLTHPFYGIVNVSCTNYTISEDMSRLGECVFTMTFLEAYENIYPVSSGDTESTINQLLDTLLPFLLVYFGAQFINFFKRNIADGADKVGSFSTALNAFGSPANTANDSFNIFSVQTKALMENKYFLVENASTLGNSMIDVMDSYNNLGITPQDSYTLNNRIFGFGNNDTVIKPTTAELIERAKNRLVFNNTVNCLALINLYKNAVAIEYKDDIQLGLIISDLEEKYQALIYNELPEDVIDKLQDVRNRARTYLEAIKVSVNKVIQVIINKMTLTNLLYMYYENFDNEDEILSLNNIFNPSIIDGEINILTQA